MTALEELSPALKIQAAMDKLDLSVRAVFVPFSRSRNAKPGAKLNDMSLNWECTILHNGYPVIATAYSAGIAHCPSYRQGRATIDMDTAVRAECEDGRSRSLGHIGKPIKPGDVDVMWSLCQDASVLDAGGFEEWASDYGYDTDSRKAEAIYRACLEIALKLRTAIGDDGLALLREAGQDY